MGEFAIKRNLLQLYWYLERSLSRLYSIYFVEHFFLLKKLKITYLKKYTNIHFMVKLIVEVCNHGYALVIQNRIAKP